jgi:hypothetical protein
MKKKLLSLLVGLAIAVVPTTGTIIPTSTIKAADISNYTLRAEDYSYASGVQKEPCSEGGQDVGYIDTNDWMSFNSVNLPVSGEYNVEYRVASQNGGGELTLEKAGGNQIYDRISVPATGGWQNWQTISHVVNLSAGVQAIGIGVPRGGFNIEWIKITPITTLRAENYSYSSEVQKEQCSEGGQDVGYIDTNDWLSFNSVTLPTSGQYRVEYRVASQNGGGVISLEQAGGIKIYGTVNVPATGGWQNWQTISHEVTLNAGTQAIGIGVPKGGYNLEWIKFIPLNGTSPSPGPSSDWNNPSIGSYINGLQTNGTVAEQKSSNWDSIIPSMSGMKVVNNLWGIPEGNGSGDGSIFSENVNGNNAYGWSWNLTSAKPNSVISYQEIGWGWSPNSSNWFNGAVPLHKISENKTYTIDMDTRRQNRNGAWNTAFDIWLYPQQYPTGGSGGKKGGYEIMVWFDHEQQGPWGSNQQDVYINGTHWKVYDNDGSAGWRVITYINQDAPITSVRNYNISNFWNDAASRYSNGIANSIGLSGDHYINAIEFGNESCGGQGMMEVKNYKLNIN